MTTAQRIQAYRKQRKDGSDLALLLMKSGPSLGFDYEKAARRLTLPFENGTLIFEDEADMAALTDFFLLDYRPRGRRLVDTVDPADIPRQYHEVLDAFRKSRASFFQMENPNPDEGTLELRDLLHPEKEPSFLTDLSLSRSFKPGDKGILFLRLVGFPSGTMSSGSFFPFPYSKKEKLLASYAERMKTVKSCDADERTYIFFFRQHRNFGCVRAFA